MMNSSARAGLVSAVADIRLGTLMSAPGDAESSALLWELAAAAPELFATDRISWDVVFGRLHSQAALQGFQELVLVSSQHVHIVLRSTQDPFIALVGVAPRTQNVGLVLSEARARLQLTQDGKAR